MSVFPCAYSIHLSVQSIQSGQYILLELRDNVHENPSELALLDVEPPSAAMPGIPSSQQLKSHFGIVIMSALLPAWSPGPHLTHPIYVVGL